MSEPEAVRRREAQTRVLRKVLVPVVIGTLTYLVTELTGQPEIWSITLAVYVGGVTVVVQFLVEFEARMAQTEKATERHSAKVERMVREGYAKISEITGLFSLVETSAVRTDAVTKLVRSVTLIDSDPSALQSRFVLKEITRVSELLEELGGRRHASYEGEDRDWLLALTHLAESSIDATSLTTADAHGRRYTDGDFWTSDLGQRYLEAQRDAVDRGVRVRRVFMVWHDVDQITDADLAKFCRLHKDKGVAVRVLDLNSARPALRDNTDDIVLFDGTASYETSLAMKVRDVARPGKVNTLLDLREEKVAGRVRRFEDLWESAHPFE